MARSGFGRGPDPNFSMRSIAEGDWDGEIVDCHDQGRKARWIEHAAALVGEGRWPEIRALAYWHEAWINGDGSQSDLHIDSSRKVRRAYRQALGGPEFSSDPVFG